MNSVQRSIYIECPIDDVYDSALVDVEGLPDWMKSVKSVDKVDDNWPDSGSSHVYTGIVVGQTFVGRTTIVRADPPHCVEMREESFVKEADGKPLSVGGSRWTFERQGNGTLATFVLSGGKQSLVSWLVWRLYGKRRTERNLEQTLANLKRICEEEMRAEPDEPDDER